MKNLFQLLIDNLAGHQNIEIFSYHFSMQILINFFGTVFYISVIFDKKTCYCKINMEMKFFKFSLRKISNHFNTYNKISIYFIKLFILRFLHHIMA